MLTSFNIIKHCQISAKLSMRIIFSRLFITFRDFLWHFMMFSTFHDLLMTLLCPIMTFIDYSWLFNDFFYNFSWLFNNFSSLFITFHDTSWLFMTFQDISRYLGISYLDISLLIMKLGFSCLYLGSLHPRIFDLKIVNKPIILKHIWACQLRVRKDYYRSYSHSIQQLLISCKILFWNQ